jgi:molybdopterin/thiamine biosynthesis adenylyltransferase
MRRGVIRRPEVITADNVASLAGFDFVFVCVDRASVRKLISDFLHTQDTPFIDVGMELQLIE